jgi:hypothetical protein
MRTEKSCGPDASTLASSLRSRRCKRRWQESRSPGRSRRKPLKPLRAGMPGDFRCDRCEYSCAFCTTTSHTRLRVHWAPGIPARPLFGAEGFAKLGRNPRRENADLCLRHCHALPQEIERRQVRARRLPADFRHIQRRHGRNPKHARHGDQCGGCHDGECFAGELRGFHAWASC